MNEFWRKKKVDERAWSEANRTHGSVYFIKDDERDMVKIGHSSTPFQRMHVLQVGSAGRLRMIGIMAAPRAFEAQMHQVFREGHFHGEWFCDREMISLFLHDVTLGEPLCRTSWDLVTGTAAAPHRIDPGTATWEIAAS